MADYYVKSGNCTDYTNRTWAANDVMCPATADATTNVNVARKYSWKVTTASGSGSGATAPTWPASVTPGTTTVTTADGTIWTGQESDSWAKATGHIHYLYNNRVAAGDRILVSPSHSETASSTATITLAGPGTVLAPVEILVVSAETSPPTALIAVGSQALLQTLGANSLNFSTGWLHVWGLKISPGSDQNTSVNSSIALLNTQSACDEVFENCLFVISSTGSGQTLAISQTGNIAGGRVEWNSCTCQFANAAQQIVVARDFYWRNSVSLALGTAPTGGLISFTSGTSPAKVVVEGVDFTNLGAHAIINAAPSVSAWATIRNCKLAASATTITGTIANRGAVQADMDDCDSGDTIYRQERYRYQGSVKQSTGVFRSGGYTYDGSNGLSLIMATLSSTQALLYTPLISPDIFVWNTLTGARTVTVEGIIDSVTIPTNADIWIDVEYLGTAGFPLTLYSQDVVAGGTLGTAGNKTSSGATWTKGGFGTAGTPFQCVSASITIQRAGLIRVRAYMAKQNATIYIDPLITVA